MSTDWCSKRYEALLSRALDLIEMFLYNAANGNSMEYQPISAAESFLNEVDAMQQELEDQKCDASYWSNLNEIVNPDLERLINNAREGIRSDDEFSEVEMLRLVELGKGAGLEKRGRSWYPQKSQIQLGFGREAPPSSFVTRTRSYGEPPSWSSRHPGVPFMPKELIILPTQQ